MGILIVTVFLVVVWMLKTRSSSGGNIWISMAYQMYCLVAISINVSVSAVTFVLFAYTLNGNSACFLALNVIVVLKSNKGTDLMFW